MWPRSVSCWGSSAFLLGLAGSGCRFGFDVIGGDDAGPFGTQGDDGGGGANGDGDGSVDAPAGGGNVVTLVGPSVTADTSVSSAATTFNYGAGLTFNVRNDAVSEFTGLVRFELSSIAAGTAIVAAELRLTTAAASLSSGQVSLYEIQQGWDQGTQVGAAGAANWTQRQSGTAWTTAGVGAGSRDTVALAVVQPYQNTTTYSLTMPASQIQKWVDTPATNFGFALVASGTGNGDSVAFVAAEGTAGSQPTLLVTTAP